MKRYIVTVGLLLLGHIVPAQSASTPASTGQRTITVTGSADVKVKPDYVVINLGVETKQAILEEAKRENDARVQRVLAFLKESGLPGNQVQTDYVAIEPSYQWNPTSKVTHFTVQKTIVVTLRDPSRFEDIVDGVVARGVTNVHGVDFRTSELKKHREQARILALRAAMEKAQKLTAELGIRRGGVLSLSENTLGGWSSWSSGSWGRHWSGGGGSQVSYSAPSQSDDSPATLPLGEIVISATVNATFELE